MSIAQYATTTYSNNNIYVLNSTPNPQTINTDISIQANEYLIIPQNSTMQISPNHILSNYGTIINYGTIHISTAAAIDNTKGSILLNEFSGTIFNDSSNNANINSGYFLNRGLYKNALPNSIFINDFGGILKIKNSGIFDNSGILINAPGGILENYYNYLTVNTGGQVWNYGQYINDIQYSSDATIYSPFNLIAAGTNHSLGLRYNNSQLYAWGDNTYGQLGNDSTGSSSTTPVSVYNGPSITPPPQTLYNNISYNYANSSGNTTLVSTQAPTSLIPSNVIDISINNLRLMFSSAGYWDLDGATLTIYNIQGVFNSIPYSDIFVGGTLSIPNFYLSPILNVSISTITANIYASSFDLIITLSSSTGQNYVNNGNQVYSSVILNSAIPYNNNNYNFLSQQTVTTISSPPSPYTLTLTPSFNVYVPPSQSYTLPPYLYTTNSPTFSYEASNALYRINTTNTFKTNELYNYTTSNVSNTISTITIRSYNINTDTIDIVEEGVNTLSLLIQVSNQLSDTFPYLNDVSLSYPFPNPVNTLTISSVSMRIINSTTTYLEFIVNADPGDIQAIAADIYASPRMSYTLTTNSNFYMNPIDILTNSIGTGNLTVTTNLSLPSYSFTTLPLNAAGHSTFTINTPINLNPPTSPSSYTGSFNTDFSFNLGFSGTPTSDLSGTQWLSIASGGNTSFGLRDQGYLYSWGDNTDGHLGIGEAVDTSRNYPSPVNNGITNWVGIASGLNHALAIDSSNQVWSWGDNTYGQLGVDTVPNSISPINSQQPINKYFDPSTNPQPYTITNPNTTSVTVGIAGGNGSYYGGLGAFITVSNIPVSVGQTIYFDIGGDGSGDGYSTLINGLGIFDPQWNLSILDGGNGNTGLYVDGAGGAGSLVYIDTSTNLIAVAGGGGGGGMGNGNSGGSPAEGGSAGGNYNTSITNIDISGSGMGAGGGNNFYDLNYPGHGYTNQNGGGGGGGGGYGGGGNILGGNPDGYGKGEDGIANSNGNGGGAGGSYVNPLYSQYFQTNITTNTLGKRSFIIENQRFSSIACGDNHSLAINQTGDLYTWGNNSSGQLGLGANITDTSRNYPSLVTNPNQEAKWIKTAGGTNHSIGLQSDGTIYAWGDNTYGQIGNGGIGASNISLNLISSPINTSFSSIGDGGRYGYFGFSFGYIYKVDLSNNTSIVSNISIQSQPTLTTSFSSIDGAYGYYGDSGGIIYKVDLSNNMQIDMSLNLPASSPIINSFTSSDGAYGYFIQDGETINKIDLPNMANPPIILGITQSPFHTSFISAIDNNYGYFCMGDGKIYRADISSTTSSVIPSTSLQISFLEIMSTSFSSADGSYCYLGGSAGKIYKVDLSGGATMVLDSSFNTGTSSQLNTSFTPDGGITGFFTNNSGTIYKLNLSTMTLISAFNITPNNSETILTSFFSNDGINSIFGDNTGTIYKINLAPISSPQQVLFNNIKWVDIAAGANVSMAISNTNQLYAWGSNISSQIAPPTLYYATPTLISSPNFLKCAIGGSHSLGIGADKNVYAWGTNTDGQLGTGNYISPIYTPTDVSGNINPIIIV